MRKFRNSILLFTLICCFTTGSISSSFAQYTSFYGGREYTSTRPYNLNIVYFVPAGFPVDPTYQTRLSAFLLWGQNFYKQNMINNGFGPKTFGLFTETTNSSNVKINRVDGASPASAYTYGDYNQERDEVNAYFIANPDQRSSEHTLIITPVTDLDNADVPFYGIGKMCFALDYPGFDIQDLGAQNTAGTLITKWFGGMMHELGHGINLRHSHQTNSEFNTLGENLMFDGNFTLGLNPTFINRAGCAVLNECQVFADAPGNTYYSGHTGFLTKLKASYTGGSLVVSGKYEINRTVKNINFYQDPYASPSQGYYAVAWSALPAGPDSFFISMPVNELENINADYNLQISLVLDNGEETFDSYSFSYNNGIPVLNMDFDYSACNTFPAEWTFVNIGTSLIPGSICYDEMQDFYIVKNQTGGVQDPEDAMPFAYKMLTGDAEITARVRTVTNAYNTSGGIMIRNSLAGSSKYVYLNALDSRGVFDIWRESDNGGTAYYPVTAFPKPMWLKLKKEGNLVSSYYSSDSTNWIFYANYSGQFNETAYLGFTGSGTDALATIDKIKVTRIFITIADGNWNNPSTWQTGIVPDADAHVFIRHNVVVTGNASCYAMDVDQPNGHITINAGVNLVIKH